MIYYRIYLIFLNSMAKPIVSPALLVTPVSKLTDFAGS